MDNIIGTIAVILKGPVNLQVEYDETDSITAVYRLEEVI